MPQGIALSGISRGLRPNDCSYINQKCSTWILFLRVFMAVAIADLLSNILFVGQGVIFTELVELVYGL